MIVHITQLSINRLDWLLYLVSEQSFPTKMFVMVTIDEEQKGYLYSMLWGIKAAALLYFTDA